MLIFSAGSVSLKPFLPIKRGDFVGCFPEELRARFRWVTRFNMVEVGGVDGILLTPSEIEGLKKAGVRKVVFYDWAPAGYHYPDGGDNPLMRWVYENRYTASLNPDGPFPHCQESGYEWCQDFYFDFANPEVIRKKTEFLLGIKRKHGYDGVFFDWASGVFILEPEFQPMLFNFMERHRGSYLRAVGRFYENLKKTEKDIFIFTNQGFRNPENVLPWADYDMSESYATDSEYMGRVLDVEGKGPVDVPDTIYYPVSEDYLNGSIEDSIYYLDYLYGIWKRARKNGFKTFFYMNYAAPFFVKTKEGKYRPMLPRNAIFYGYCLAKLRNFPSYTEVPFERRLEETDLYFYDLGTPLGEDYEKIPGGYVRYFTHGFVVVGQWDGPSRITLESPFLLEKSPVYDLYREGWTGTVKGGRITILIVPERDPFTGRMAPAGRAFLYPSSRLFRKFR